MNFNLEANDKITFFMINGMAMTTKREVIVIKETDTEVLFKESSRKRKVYGLNKEKVPLVFKGHNILVGSDSDGQCWRGNACINLVSTFDAEDVKRFIEDENLSFMTEEDKAHTLLFTKEQADDSQYEECLANCLYPDAGSASSMVHRIRETV